MEIHPDTNKGGSGCDWRGWCEGKQRADRGRKGDLENGSEWKGL